MTRLPKNIRALPARLARIVRCTLSEIFDESAYARFLERQKLESSPESYAEFLRENEAARSRRPRCC